MFNLDWLERTFNLSVHVEASLVHKIIKSSLIELVLHCRKNSLNWIEVWAVAYVEHWLNITVFIPRFHIFRLVDRSIVHEQSQLDLPQFSTKHLHEVYEVVGVTRSVLYLNMNDSSLFTHCCNHITVTNVNIFLIDSEIGSLSWPLLQSNSFLIEQSLIEVNNHTTLVFDLCNFMDKVHTPLLEVNTSGHRKCFLLPYLLPLDSVLEVESSKWVGHNSFMRELAVKHLWSFLQSQACPHFESAWT